jgi:hypothetical protein
MRTSITIACAAMAFVAVAGGTAEATGLIHTANIANGAITFDKLSPGVQKHVWERGAKGPDGPAGTTGVTGSMGATGAPGPRGATGVQGAKGENGLAGESGASGAAGARGVEGDTGPAGPAGADSDDVRPVTATSPNGFVLNANGDNGDASPNGTVSFVAAADAPRGHDVLDMQTTTGKSVVAYLPAAAGRLLSELTSFGYASKVISSPNPAYDVTAQIEVVRSGAAKYPSGYTTVVFEPYVNGNQGTVGWHRNDVVHGKVWSTQALPSGDCSQAAPCAFSTFIAENPQATVLSAPKFRIGQNSGTPLTDAGHYQVDDVIYGFGSALNFDLGA